MIKFTTEIVAAFLANNSVPYSEIPEIIRSTYAALVSAASPEEVVPERAHPAVPIKKSVTPDAVICLECGAKLSMLKRHLKTHHDMAPADYRAKWDLPATYSLVAPNYATRRSDLAKKIGLGYNRTKAVAKVAPIVSEKPKRGRKKIVVE